MFGHRWRLAEGVEDRRALDDDGRLLMARQVSDRGLVDATSGVDVHGIDDFVGWLCVLVRLVLYLVLPGWREQKASVRSEGESSEEGREGLVRIETCILRSQGPIGAERMVRLRRRLHRHNSRKRQRRRWGDRATGGNRRSSAVADYARRVHGQRS